MATTEEKLINTIDQLQSYLADSLRAKIYATKAEYNKNKLEGSSNPFSANTKIAKALIEWGKETGLLTETEFVNE